jgi:hypothetical protein
MYNIITYLISIVWVINGLFCKILGLVPRHEAIVGKILGIEFAGILTQVIGGSEILMAVWVISGIQRRLNAVVQIMLVATMNLIEFILAPDLLLWGRFNSLFAGIFIVIIYYWEFILHQKANR